MSNMSPTLIALCQAFAGKYAPVAETPTFKRELMAIVEQAKREGAPAAAPKPTHTGAGPTFRFGKLQGQPLRNGSERDLQWYSGALRQSLEDPAKERWRDDNAEHLAEVEAEIAERAGR